MSDGALSLERLDLCPLEKNLQLTNFKWQENQPQTPVKNHVILRVFEFRKA